MSGSELPRAAAEDADALEAHRLKLLLLSFYFEPDLSAGSFRSTALVLRLREAAAPNAEIEVLTTQPNRYSSFSANAPAREFGEGVEVHRFALPSHRSGMLDQSRSFVAYARQVLRHVESRRYGIVVATSSRLMTAALGALVARRKRAVLYLDIRDIFVDTIGDVLPGFAALLAGPALRSIEHWAMSRAERINLVSRGFAEYFSTRYPDKPLSFFTNGVDEEFAAAAADVGARVAPRPAAERVTVVYAGNLGDGQGLHLVVPALAKSMNSRIRFRIIGDGGRRPALQQALAAAKVDNVELLPPVPRGELIAAYREADVLFLHLNNVNAFRKVLPSKIFEYAAMGKPIWAGVAGYAAEFIRSEIDNAAVFAPCEADEAEQVFGGLVLRDAARAGFIEKYARGRIMGEMARDILSLQDRCGSLRRESLRA